MSDQTIKAATNTTPAKTQANIIAKRTKAAIAKTATKLQRFKIEYVPINSIFPNNYNPNRQTERDFELLCKSIEEDGFTTPILCNDKTREIVDGEHRWRAAHAMGMTEIPCVFTDMTPEQMRISTIRHNRARGSHDIDLEAEVLHDLEQLGALGWAQDALMMSDKELNRLLEDVPAPEALAFDEFSTAWEPDRFSDETAANIADGTATTEVKETIKNEFGGTLATAMTLKAIEETRTNQEHIAAAATDEERAYWKREHALYRVHVTYSNDEAKLVKTVLGSRPAEKLLAMCQRRLAERQSTGGRTA